MSGSPEQDADYINSRARVALRQRTLERETRLRQRQALQRELDSLDSEINLNAELCRELESRRAKLEAKMEELQ